MKNRILKLTLIVPVATLLFTGCATKPMSEPYRDIEPSLVGLPMKDKIITSSTRIKEKFDLLNKVQSNEYVGKYDLPVHNQNLDARIGSKRTLPKAYANKDEVIAKARAEQAQKDLLVEKRAQIIKKIDWQNASLNILVKNFATALDYNIVYISKEKDMTVNFKVENESLESAFRRLTSEVKQIALITQDDNVKTVFLNYN